MSVNDREERSNRPKIIVEETEAELFFSLAVSQPEIGSREADMETSMHEMSLGDIPDTFDSSISSSDFHPDYESSPLPSKFPFLITSKKPDVVASPSEVIATVVEEGLDQTDESDFFWV